jgi:hypothetical protein
MRSSLNQKCEGIVRSWHKSDVRGFDMVWELVLKQVEVTEVTGSPQEALSETGKVTLILVVPQIRGGVVLSDHFQLMVSNMPPRLR